ncbi:S8 family serine peptidase [Nonomuraea sp. NPDC048916]|uniref:S8 family serine peptidase n=1 Tax=Nonomuraea sp. NPDC048916 TaxID=3154232 RepID=UPI0033F1A7C8
MFQLSRAVLVTACLSTLLVIGAAPSAGGDLTTERWQLSALWLHQAWRLSKGQGVLVAVLDTGVNGRHPDLAGAVVHGPDLTGPSHGHGRRGHHGTAMAGLIAGRGHDGGQGVIGVAPAARVLSIRVTLELDDPLREKRPSAGHDALARGIRYAADHGAAVISMSLGGGSGSWRGSAAEQRAVRYAISRGAVLVASAGNDGDTTNRKNFPAAYPGVIAVGAVDRRLRVTRFSNRQDYLSVVAPGTGITSADGRDSYLTGDGTSSAAAMVAGIAALIRAAHPELPPHLVRRAIELGTTKRPATGHDSSYGHGVANALLALRQAGLLAGAPTRPARAARRPAAGTPPSRTPVVLGLVLLSAGMSARLIVRQGRHGGRST